MRQHRIRLRDVLLSAITGLVLWTIGDSPTAAQQPAPPPFFAIRDAEIMTGTGETLERATLLIADGLIEAVGRDLDIPPDAWVLDGTGLMVYPGLIDGMNQLGQKQPDEAPRSGPGARAPGGRPGSSTPPARGPEDRPGTTPWRDAADLLVAEDARLAEWREAGFTTAITVPADGFFAGRAAAIHLGESSPQDRVLATHLAHRINFTHSGGRRSFPSSLMGGISYVKQVLSDARHYGQAAALYSESPRGRNRPRYDRSLEPIHTAVVDGTPMLLPADLGRHIDRALAIARDYELRPVLYGMQAGYARVETLKNSGAGVLVDLDWPEAEKDVDPETDTPLPILHHRRKARATPALLAAAGVPFGFYSGDLSSPSKVLAGVRAAIAEGLSDDDALKALTLGTAKLFALEDRIGSIEVGKIANLVVATATPWSEDNEIRAVFVDGQKFQKREESEDHEPPASDVSGTWALALETPGGSREMTAELNMSEDGKVTGELTSPRGTRTVDKGRMSGDRLTFKMTQTMGPRTMEASYSLTVSDEEVNGTLSAGPHSMELSGERTAQKEPGATDENDEPAVSLAELDEAMAAYAGPVDTLTSFAITNATVYTVSGETLENGTVVVSEGKIRAVGTEVKIPRGASVIDANGGSLIPGIIDAHSHIAIEGGGNEGSVAVSSMVTIQDVIDPDDISIYRALAGGVTTVNVLHGSANPIGGGNAVLKLKWGQDAAGLRFAEAPSGIKFALGENPKRSRVSRTPGVEPRYPATRMGVMDVIRQAFTEAREYQKTWQQHAADVKAGRQPIPPRVDFKLQRLVEILEGERLVHSHCYRADEILQLLRLAEELGFKIATLQHVLEGYKVADEIAAHGAGASTFSDWWGYKVEAYDAIPHNAALMTERGVRVSINSDSAEEMRHLNQEAAKTIKWGGLDEIEALKLVTLNPALQLGIGERVGSIEVGKDADLTLYDGHPLSMFSVVQKTFVDGDLYFDRAADRKRQATLDSIKEKLKPEEDAEEEAAEKEAGEDHAADAPKEAETPDPSPPDDGSQLNRFASSEAK